MKKSELILSASLIPLDFLLLTLALLSAYAIRFNTYITEIRPVIFDLAFVDFLPIALFIATAGIIIFAFSGLYKIETSRSIIQELIRVVLATATGFFILVIYFFWQREFFDSRFIILVALGFTILYVSIGRVFVRFVQKMLYTKGVGLHNLVIIGSSSSGDNIAATYHKNKSFGYTIIDRIKEPEDSIVSQLKRIEKEKHIDDILFIDAQQVGQKVVSEIINWSTLTHVAFHYSSEYLNWPAAGVNVFTVDGVPVMEFKKTPLDGWGRITKRLFDIVVSAILIAVTIPAMFFMTLIIKIDSKGPILFSNKDDGSKLMRIGQYGKPFRYFKFRTMIPKSDNLRYTKEFTDKNVRAGTPMVKINDDPRVTRVGNFFRRFSLDELPELFLVLRGSMSLVGPRPHLPEEVAKYQNQHKIVLTIKPGITGLAQISGRSDLHFNEEVRLDSYYIQNWSLKLDLQILVKTIPAVLKRRKVL